MQTKSTNTTAIQTIKANELMLDVGEEAWALLSQDLFLTDWDALYKACPWTTVFQSRAFVATWYKTYRSKYLPIIIRAVYDGKLTGLITLAAPASGNKGHIVGAGQFEAEYHAWLTDASDDGSFIKAALSKVQQQFPHFAIHLRYIPPQAPLQWVSEQYWKKRSVVYAVSRPLMDMNDPGRDKMFRKEEFRSKLNRLKRLGQVEFERVTSKDHFAAIVKELIVLYDFRRGAMFNKNLFKEEPLKADFLMGLFEQNLLHVTVLKVNGQIFASIAATTMNDQLHLCGINVHIPFHAKYFSPGFVHFILLGQQLAKEGVAVFDLTPGGDFYKKRMAIRHDQVYELMITNSRSYRIKRLLRKRIYEWLEKKGKWPMETELALRKRLYLLKGRIRQARKQGLLKTGIDKIKNVINPPQNSMYAAAA